MMVRPAILPAALALSLSAGSMSVVAAEDGLLPAQQDWSFRGVFGEFDEHALQRGFQVYQEVCSACHSLKYVAFRHLEGIGLNEDHVKAIAGEYQVQDGPDDFGDLFDRPGLPSDFLPNPFPNEEAARAANGGALPPDLSLITSARASRFGHIGADYVYSLLTGYQEDVPADVVLQEGSNYNPYFAGGAIGMAAPLFDEMVTYADGTPTTVDQMSRDVATFLAWAADPREADRKRIGFKVVIFLLFLTALFYATKRKIWAGLH